MKQKCLAIALCMTVLLFVVPSAQGLQGFQPIRVNGNLRLAVYSAPSTSSWRGANGKAMCNTDGRVYAAGREGGWVLIAYYLNHGVNAGGWRVGYVQYHELKGLLDYIQPLSFRYQSATINTACYLTDDPMGLEEPITRLSPGTSVTYLMGYENDYGVRYAYIETTYGWQTVRGFVRYDCVNIGY